MKRIRLVRRILNRTYFIRIMWIFLAFMVFCAVFIWLYEPSILTLRDGVWYVYTVVTTIGFGDVLVETLPSRVLSILLSIYSHFALALITGLVLTFFNELNAMRHRDTISAFIDKLERLPELSKEELAEISEKVKMYEERRS
jgi:voltage-gated potassium channel